MGSEAATEVDGKPGPIVPSRMVKKWGKNVIRFS
jgi:hypothetical protein